MSGHTYQGGSEKLRTACIKSQLRGLQHNIIAIMALTISPCATPTTCGSPETVARVHDYADGFAVFGGAWLCKT